MKSWVDNLRHMLSPPKASYLKVRIMSWDPVYSWSIVIEDRQLLTEYDKEGYLCAYWKGALRPVRRNNWEPYYMTPFVFKGERIESVHGFFLYENLSKEIVK